MADLTTDAISVTDLDRWSMNITTKLSIKLPFLKTSKGTLWIINLQAKIHLVIKF